MKHCLLAIFLILLLPGCKKEEETPKTLEELIKGKWYVVDETSVFYDAANVKLREGGGITEFGEMEITESNVMQNHSTGSLISGTYTISESNGKKFINISQGTDLRKFQIDTVTQSSMTWVKETFNEWYWDGNRMQPAARRLFYLEFQRR